MGPLFIFLGLAVVGIGVAGWVSGLQRKEAAEAAERARTARENRTDETDPFADVPPENNPFSGAKTAAGSAAGGPLTSSEELLADKTWSKALEIGAHADKLADEAKAAKRVDNHELFNIKGKAAKEKSRQAESLGKQIKKARKILADMKK